MSQLETSFFNKYFCYVNEADPTIVGCKIQTSKFNDMDKCYIWPKPVSGTLTLLYFKELKYNPLNKRFFSNNANWKTLVYDSTRTAAAPFVFMKRIIDGLGSLDDLRGAFDAICDKPVSLEYEPVKIDDFSFRGLDQVRTHMYYKGETEMPRNLYIEDCKVSLGMDQKDKKILVSSAYEVDDKKFINVKQDVRRRKYTLESLFAANKLNLAYLKTRDGRRLPFEAIHNDF